MSKSKQILVVTDWSLNIKDIGDAKKSFKRVEKEYGSLEKANKKNKKEKTTKDLDFFVTMPESFIFPIKSFLLEKSNKKIKKITLGSKVSEERNENIFLKQIKSIGGKFIIINDGDLPVEIVSEIERDGDIEKKNVRNSPNKTRDIILHRLSRVKGEEVESKKEIYKLDQNKINQLEERLHSSLEEGLTTILKIKVGKIEDLKIINDFIKRLIKNLHYNLFEKLIICYQGSGMAARNDIENCLEKTIAIRRTFANIFGIDNAKKIKIIYSGDINQNNIKDILDNAGVDGILLTGGSSEPDTLAKILYKINSK
jgi:hypothetical protein